MNSLEDVYFLRDMCNVVEQEIKRRLNIILGEIEADIDDSTANRIVEINETIKKNIKQQLNNQPPKKRTNNNKKKNKSKQNNNNNNNANNTNNNVNNQIPDNLEIDEHQKQIFASHNLVYTVNVEDERDRPHFFVSGNTYPYRNDFNKLGGIYRKNQKGWLFYPHNQQKVLSYLFATAAKQISEPPTEEDLKLNEEQQELIAKHNLTYTVEDSLFFVGGNNYPYRKIFTSLGGKFQRPRKAWRFRGNTKDRFFLSLSKAPIHENESDINLELDDEKKALISTHNLEYKFISDENRNNFYVGGNTYPYRQLFKNLGGKWLRNDKQWYFFARSFKNFFNTLSTSEVHPIVEPPQKNNPANDENNNENGEEEQEEEHENNDNNNDDSDQSDNQENKDNN